MYSAEEKIKRFAITSRVFVFGLQFIANYLIPDHDAGVFKKPMQLAPSFNDSTLTILTEGLTRWDGQYFLHIAEYGYTYENTLAFFPMFPLALSFFAIPFQIVVNNFFYWTELPFFLTTHDATVLMSIVLNGVLFVHCALILYKLSLVVTKNEQLSYTAALLFCVNPASIFFSAVYSETLFFFFTLSGMMYIESGSMAWGALVFGLSSMTRSNGLINIGYLAHRVLKTRRNALSIIFAIIVFICCILIAVLPFISYQFFCYTKFCVQHNVQLPEVVQKYGRRNGFVLPGSVPLWCHQPLPFAYSYVQSHYWEVGFLKYYEAKQLPNFALAFPVISLTLYGAYHFIQNHGLSLIYLGFVPGNLKSKLPTTCFPYIVHAVALAIFGATCMHVQVTTRLICSSCPAFYWLCGRVIVEKMCDSKERKVAKKITRNENSWFESMSNKKSWWKNLLLTERFLGLALLVRYYFFAYFLAGPAVFANHLPWT